MGYIMANKGKRSRRNRSRNIRSRNIRSRRNRTHNKRSRKMRHQVGAGGLEYSCSATFEHDGKEWKHDSLKCVPREQQGKKKENKEQKTQAASQIKAAMAGRLARQQTADVVAAQDAAASQIQGAMAGRLARQQMNQQKKVDAERKKKIEKLKDFSNQKK